jgi:tRNA (adenine57-N1/adenine58-N1)-methyltransferase catalytic subunit
VEHRRDQLAWNLHSTHTQDGDIVELVGLRHKHFLVQLKQDAIFQSHRGIIKHADLIGLPWGSQVLSHLGSPFFVIQPALGDLLRETRRQTQILYPKDIGFLMVTMGIGPGQHIIEAGTGSGALTTALAFSVGKEGKVFSYDKREDFQKLAKENLSRIGLDERVIFKIGDIANGFDETDADALFLDVPNPFDYMAQVKKALRPGGFFGCILPTTNQVSILLTALRHELFAFIDVCEVMLRYYQAEADRFRPTDRMVAHTGYLIFARPVLPGTSEVAKELLIENTTDNNLEQL